MSSSEEEEFIKSEEDIVLNEKAVVDLNNNLRYLEIAENDGKWNDFFKVFKEVIEKVKVSKMFIKNLCEWDISLKLIDVKSIHASKRKSFNQILKTIKSTKKVYKKYMVDDITKKLYLINNHVVNNRFQEAKIMYLSIPTSSIEKTSTKTKNFFNKTCVEMGMCAFRNGYLLETNLILKDFYRNKNTPSFMEVDTYLADCMFLITLILFEAPWKSIYNKRSKYEKDRSKMFIRFLRKYNRPLDDESDISKIYNAGLQLMSCDWKKCFNLLSETRACKNLSPEIKSKLFLEIKKGVIFVDDEHNFKC